MCNYAHKHIMHVIYYWLKNKKMNIQVYKDSSRMIHAVFFLPELQRSCSEFCSNRKDIFISVSGKKRKWLPFHSVSSDSLQ